MRRLSIGFLTLAALAAAALSPSRATAEYRWTGPYAGANAGMGLSSGRVEDPDCWFCSSDSFSEKLFQLGLHGGYNKQINNVVLGGEAQVDYGTQFHRGSVNNAVGGTNHASDDSRLNWTLSALARAGLVNGNAMFYVGAGPALSWISGGATVGLNNPPFHYSVAYWQPGFKGVLGAEFFVAEHASVRAQYGLLMVSERSAWQTPNANSPSANASRLTWVNQQSVLTLGLDWHF